VGACASIAGGEIVYSARNRVNDGGGPAGEIFGSALAHAETNVLARLPFRGRRDLVLTTTLQPCLQCAGAIRLGPIAIVRFAGPDHYWDGCHDFAKLSAREAQRAQPVRIGPRRDEGSGNSRRSCPPEGGSLPKSPLNHRQVCSGCDRLHQRTCRRSQPCQSGLGRAGPETTNDTIERPGVKARLWTGASCGR
jgi:tRNA(Arg) A34 adenosine deaminase TadA